VVITLLQTPPDDVCWPSLQMLDKEILLLLRCFFSI